MTDTIAAIATGLTESGIGIIRISGAESYDIIRKIFVTKAGKEPNLAESHKVHYGFITTEGAGNVSRETLDEVLMLNMKGPHSYTGEDTIEIDCHGGVLMMKRILGRVLSAGARPAEPGEFTKRAFLNGRLDLSQAEAVIDVINAKNDYALRASVRQLKGSVSEEIKACRAVILEDTAYIEAALDDPEHISLEGFREKLTADVETLLKKTDRLIASSENGRLIKEGIRTVILGKPNAGKSSLLNALMGEERAIVTEIAGTTRDTLEEYINLRGLSLNIIDTAGIRDTEDVVEQIGVERALKAAENADLIIYVVDASAALNESDERIIRFIKEHDKRYLVILNKSDLTQKVTAEMLRTMLLDGEEKNGQLKDKEAAEDKEFILSVSAKHLTGLDALEEKIEALFYSGDVSYNDEIYITSARQKAALVWAQQALCNLQTSIEADMPEDFYSIDLLRAYQELGLVLGEEVDEDLVNEIFEKFCMGK